MKMWKLLPIAGLAVLVVGAQQVSAATIFSDDFENYTLGSIDNNDTVNNVASNPWYGPYPANGIVVGATQNGGISTTTVTPYSGSKMIQGDVRNDGKSHYDQDGLDLSKYNNENAFTGNLEVSWYFYDSAGVGGTTANGKIEDFVALSYYNPTVDKTGAASSWANSCQSTLDNPSQRISLGALSAGDTSYYQARVLNSSSTALAYNTTGDQSWFNTTATRSIGWHEGTISIGALQTDNTNLISFYVDGIECFSTTAAVGNGYNTIEMNTRRGGQTLYYDDFTASTVPEPASFLALGSGLISLLALKKRRS